MKKIAIPLDTPVGDLEDLLRICLDLHNGDTALRITDHFDEARQGGYINARDPRFIEFLILAIAACQLYNGKQVTSYRYLLRQLAYVRNLNPAQLELLINSIRAVLTDDPTSNEYFAFFTEKIKNREYGEQENNILYCPGHF